MAELDGLKDGAAGEGLSTERVDADGSREVVDSSGVLLLREAGGVRKQIFGGAMVETRLPEGGWSGRGLGFYQ